MAESLTVTASQPDVADGDVASNAERHAAVVRGVPDSRVVMFPELSLTGYRLDAEAVDPAEPRLRPLVAACGETGTIALAGAPTSGPTGDHLSILLFEEDEVRVVYHKLFLGGDEAERFRPGEEPAVLEVDGWRLGLAICRDTGVADHADRTAGLGIDAYLAGVCEHAADHEVIGERASSIAERHGIWVGMASFAGQTGHGYRPAAGRSGFWAPDGRLVDRSGPDPGRSVTAVLRR